MVVRGLLLLLLLVVVIVLGVRAALPRVDEGPAVPSSVGGGSRRRRGARGATSAQRLEGIHQAIHGAGDVEVPLADVLLDLSVPRAPTGVLLTQVSRRVSAMPVLPVRRAWRRLLLLVMRMMMMMVA